MASAVTYLHAKVTINFTTVEDQHYLYNSVLTKFKDELNKQRNNLPSKHYTYPNASYAFMVDEMWNDGIDKSFSIINSKQQVALNMIQQLTTIRKTLPDRPKERSRFVREANDTQPANNRTLYSHLGLKQPPVIKLTVHNKPTVAPRTTRLPRIPGVGALIAGAIGTVFGLYNNYRINQLNRDLEEVKGKHNQLIEILDDQQNSIDQINFTITTIMNYIKFAHKIDPFRFLSQCNSIEQQIQNNLHRVIHAVQMAQVRRLSVDLLDSFQLDRLFKRLKLEAKNLDNVLLIDKISDLFQLEVTYFSDGQDVHLLIHVPSVPKNGLLDLYKLHPFPLPIDGNYSLIPMSDNNILALTPDHRKYHTQLSTTQLMDCQQINTVYICERHGVLTKNLSNSCLGSMYLQDYGAVQHLCQIQVMPTRELVFQLLGNWFLIYSPVVFTADVQCQNGTLSRFFIPVGISKHFLSPGCHADFKENVLLSNNAVRLESDLIHFEWKWEEEIFKTLTPLDLLDSLQTIQQSGISSPTLNDITTLKVTQKSGYNYLFHILGFILSTTATAIITIGLLFLLARYYNTICSSYQSCLKCCCTSNQEPIEPVGAEESMALNQRSLPIYTETYKPADQLYPNP